MNMIHFLFFRLTNISRSFIPENRRHLKNREEKFVRHVGSKVSGSQQTKVSQIWQKRRKNWHAWLFGHDCTQEQNVSPYFFLHLSTMQIAVSVKKGSLPWKLWCHLSMGDRHKNRAIACPIDIIFWRTSQGISGWIVLTLNCTRMEKICS